MSILKYIMSPFVEFKEDERSPSSKEIKTERDEKKKEPSDPDNQPDPGASEINASSPSLPGFEIPCSIPNNPLKPLL